MIENIFSSKEALSLLLMDKEDDRQHFSLKKIMEEEGTNLSKTKRKKLKKLKKMGDTKAVEDTFKVCHSIRRWAIHVYTFIVLICPTDRLNKYNKF